MLGELSTDELTAERKQQTHTDELTAEQTTYRIPQKTNTVELTAEQAFNTVPNTRVVLVRQKNDTFHVFCKTDRLIPKQSEGAIPVAHYQGVWHKIIPARTQQGDRRIFLGEILPEVADYDLVDWIDPEYPEETKTLTRKAIEGILQGRREDEVSSQQRELDQGLYITTPQGTYFPTLESVEELDKPETIQESSEESSRSSKRPSPLDLKIRHSPIHTTTAITPTTATGIIERSSPLKTQTFAMATTTVTQSPSQVAGLFSSGLRRQSGMPTFATAIRAPDRPDTPPGSPGGGGNGGGGGGDGGDGGGGGPGGPQPPAAPLVPPAAPAPHREIKAL